MPPIKLSDTPKRLPRRKAPIEPVHVEELLSGAGMNGFLGVLNAPAPAPAPQAASGLSARVASVVLKVKALKQLMNKDA